jgi:hypothetical protein
MGLPVSGEETWGSKGVGKQPPLERLVLDSSQEASRDSGEKSWGWPRVPSFPIRNHSCGSLSGKLKTV